MRQLRVRRNMKLAENIESTKYAEELLEGWQGQLYLLEYDSCGRREFVW